MLWSGSFTSGSITVPNLSNYVGLAVELNGQILAYGNKTYGIGGNSEYGGYGVAVWGYRLISSTDTLTIDTYAKGGTNGTSQVPITKVYGLF